MATEVGQAVVKLSFDTKSLDKSQAEAERKITNAGTSSGSAWGNAWTVAAGNLIAKGVEKVASAIQNNLGNAIKRVDVMNNFPKVMQNLGISADASSRVIKDLSEKLMGLPTTLDSATLAVQRFTSKNGDVEKSERIFLAVNNAILAGGASAEIQASAMEQLSQAYSKGKPDMMEWRTIQTAMPAQLKQVATQMLGNVDALQSYLNKARTFAKENPLNSAAKELVEQLEAVADGTGDMTTALGTALRSGVISMDEFTDTMIEMNKTGTKGFASFEKQARSATGGIETSMTNLNTAISRAIANVINSIGSERINRAIQGIIGFINQLGNTISGVVNFIIDNGGVIVSVLAGIGTAMATAFVVDKVKAFTTAIQSLTSAFVSPTGLIAAAAGLVVGLISVVNATDDVESRMSETSKFLRDMGDSLAENKRSWEELQAAQEKQLSAGMSEMAYYQSLASELDRIVDENGRVQSGYEQRAEFIASRLKDALGVEISLQDGVIKGYQGIKDSINQVIAQKKAKIILDAQEAGYTEAIKQQQVALEQMGSTQEEITRKHAEWMNAEYQLEQQRSTMSQQQIIDAQNRIFALKNEEQALTDTLNAQKTQYGQYTFQIGVYEDNMAKFHAGEYDAMNTATWGYIQKFSEAEQAEKAMLEDQISTTRGAMTTLEELYKQTGDETYRIQYESNQKKYDKLVESHKKYEKATQNNQAATLAIWNEGLGNILSTISGKQVEFRKEGDGSISQYVKGVKSQSWESAAAFNGAIDQALGQIQLREGEFYSVGKNLMAGVIKGVREGKNGLVDGMVDAIIKTADAARAVAQIKSPSRVFAEIGYYIDKGLELGIRNNAGGVAAAAESMVHKAASASGEVGGIDIAANIPDHSSVLEQVYRVESEDKAASGDAGQPLVVNLELDGQQIQRVILQDERRATV
ncbi:tape measure protein [Candidatus Saccharibacteria bacterium]|nr:tape measure protein [Candidatus Saccharibacteria bacterium]